jgi:hypothetical protein
MDYLLFILVYVLGYAVFMLLAYVLAKVIFTKIETKEELEKGRLTQLELIKAKRVRVKKQRLAHVQNKKIGHRLLPA